ncbi:MAG: hypothetical protein C4306_08860 [Thermoleophilia bacterium]
MTASKGTTTEAGRRPQKLCSSCGRNTAASYYWWLEETNVRFICRECRDSRSTGTRAVPISIGLESLVHLDDDVL